MEKKIIAIQGNKGSGKDTAALYIRYLLGMPKIFHNYNIAKLLNFRPINSNWEITRYATALKQVLSILLGVNVDNFENRDFKENYYYNFNDGCFVLSPDKDKILSDANFNRQLKKGNLDIFTQYYLSVRQILQAFGTNLMRRYLGDNLWINLTLNNDKNLIISDQRFFIENDAVKNIGTIIHIIRPGNEISKHPSEKELVKMYQKKQYDYLINNNGSLEDLFNECKLICYCL
jgi:hypothetical protein